MQREGALGRRSAPWLAVRISAAGLLTAGSLFGGLAAGSTHAAAAPGLSGETLQAGCGALPPQDVASCQTNPPAGSVTVSCTNSGLEQDFTATGTAFGPYPGTFTETGSFTLGANGTGADGHSQDVTGFSATFTISSAAGTVTGTKDATGVTQNVDNNFCGQFAGAGANYTATIMPPGGGSFVDTGQSRTQVGCAPAGPNCPAALWEPFGMQGGGPPPVVFAPGGGAFAISDLESANGTHVTFWGAQWWKANPASTGARVASFKGFALNPSVPKCGDSWSTSPGNSAPPPSGPLPAMMGLIVTSHYAHAGSQVSGDVVHIVIVKTDPGYQPNPGHPGTGTVVMQVC